MVIDVDAIHIYIYGFFALWVSSDLMANLLQNKTYHLLFDTRSRYDSSIKKKCEDLRRSLRIESAPLCSLVDEERVVPPPKEGCAAIGTTVPIAFPLSVFSPDSCRLMGQRARVARCARPEGIAPATIARSGRCSVFSARMGLTRST